jgi:hypothetical protein
MSAQKVNTTTLEKNDLGDLYRVLETSRFGGGFQLSDEMDDWSRAVLRNASIFHVQPKDLDDASTAVVARNTEIVINGQNADGSLEATIYRNAVVAPFTSVVGHFMGTTSSPSNGIYQIDAESGDVYSSETHNIYIDAFRDLCEHGAKKLEGMQYNGDIMERLQQPDMCKTPSDRQALVADLSSALTIKQRTGSVKQETDTILATIMARYA